MNWVKKNAMNVLTTPHVGDMERRSIYETDRQR